MVLVQKVIIVIFVFTQCFADALLTDYQHLTKPLLVVASVFSMLKYFGSLFAVPSGENKKTFVRRADENISTPHSKKKKHDHFVAYKFIHTIVAGIIWTK